MQLSRLCYTSIANRFVFTARVRHRIASNACRPARISAAGGTSEPDPTEPLLAAVQ